MYFATKGKRGKEKEKKKKYKVTLLKIKTCKFLRSCFEILYSLDAKATIHANLRNHLEKKFSASNHLLLPIGLISVIF